MNKDIGILLLFFNKVESTEKVLKRILEAKPGNLFLAQDGAREGNEFDAENVPRCRAGVERLVEDINWECNVYRNYSAENLSCDPKEYESISWAFGIVDKLIVIEDDCLCSRSFFTFMEEMLIFYEKDERISMVSGMERFGKNPYCADSYYFTQASCGCGWGSWKRVWNDVQRISNGYDFVLDRDFAVNLDKYVKKSCLKVYTNYVNRSKKNREDNLREAKMLSWEFALSTAMILESRLSISPSVNLVKNIGIVPGATHSGNDIRTLPKRNRRIFELCNYEINFPLKHPRYMVRDIRYEEMHDKEFSTNVIRKIHDDMERLILMIRYGYFRDIFKGVYRRIDRIGK